MLWLCIRLSELPLLVWDRAIDCLQPVGIVEQRRILCANTAAIQSGIKPGQTLAMAQALYPELISRPRQLQREQQKLKQLALLAYQFTPHTVIRPPDCLLLELSRSLRLFKGFHRLLAKLQKKLHQQGITPHLGLAHTAEAAYLLSHCQHSWRELVHPQDQQLDLSLIEQQLIDTPLHILPIADSVRANAEAMGIRKLGELLSLPAAALNKRLGYDFGFWLERVTGAAADPQDFFQPPDFFFSERHFNSGLIDQQQLRFPIAGLLSELGHYLQIKQWLNRDLHWQITGSEGQRQNLTLGVSQPFFNRNSLLELVMLKLEKTPQLPVQIDSLSLRCHHFEPIHPQHAELFSHPEQTAAQHNEQYQQLMDRLTAKLGQKAFFTLASQDSHLPEQAWQANGTSSPLPANSLLRPLWLLTTPEPLKGQPPPAALQLLQGPERIDSHWWQHRQVRDYYIARRGDGSLYWIYKDCLNGHWFIHGLFS